MLRVDRLLGACGRVCQESKSFCVFICEIKFRYYDGVIPHVRGKCEVYSRQPYILMTGVISLILRKLEKIAHTPSIPFYL